MMNMRQFFGSLFGKGRQGSESQPERTGKPEATEPRRSDSPSRQGEKGVSPACSNRGGGLGRRNVTSPQAGYAVGDVLCERYVIRGVLGKGGFGQVYLATHNKGKCICAIKGILPEYLNDRNRIKALKKEALVWLHMGRHPFIVPALWVQEWDDSLFVGTPDFDQDGKVTSIKSTLQDYLNSSGGNLDRVTILRWAIQMCYAMEHAQKEGVCVHRDIKPANVLIGNGSAMLSDFGLAVWDHVAVPNVETGRDRAAGKTLTLHEDGLHGTVGYISPESYEGTPPAVANDIYAFGVVLWQMAERRSLLPYVVNRREKDNWVLDFAETVSRQRDFGWHLDDQELSNVVCRCTGNSPEARYRSFAELRQDLQTIYWAVTGHEVEVPKERSPQARDLSDQGTSFAILGEEQEAINCIKEAVALAPEEAEILYNCGNIYLQFGHLPQAESSFRSALGLEPDHVNAWSNLAAALSLLNRHEEAIECDDRALAIRPDWPSQHFNRGVSLEKAGRHSEALLAYKKALQLDPTYEKARLNMGNALVRLNRPAEAVPCYDHVIASPSSLREAALVCKAAAMGALNDHDCALACCNAALKINSGNAEAWANKAAALLLLGELEEAGSCCDFAQAYGSASPAIFTIKSALMHLRRQS